MFLHCVEEEVADVWNSSSSLAPGIVETDKYKSDSYQPKVLMSIVKKYNNFTKKNLRIYGSVEQLKCFHFESSFP